MSVFPERIQMLGEKVSDNIRMIHEYIKYMTEHIEHEKTVSDKKHEEILASIRALEETIRALEETIENHEQRIHDLEER